MVEARRQQRIAVRALERRLINEFPALLDAVAPKPLAIGIHRDVVRATGATGGGVRLVLGAWTSRPTYLAALVAGAPRARWLGGGRGDRGTGSDRPG
jgi:hypothetical protein